MDLQFTTTIKPYTDRPGQSVSFSRNQLSGFLDDNDFQTTNEGSGKVPLSSLTDTDILAAFAAGVSAENVSAVILAIDTQTDGTVATGDSFTVKIGATAGAAADIMTGSFFQFMGELPAGDKLFVTGTGSAMVKILIYFNPPPAP
jgi:hypothetical protein